MGGGGGVGGLASTFFFRSSSSWRRSGGARRKRRKRRSAPSGRAWSRRGGIPARAPRPGCRAAPGSAPASVGLSPRCAMRQPGAAGRPGEQALAPPGRAPAGRDCFSGLFRVLACLGWPLPLPALAGLTAFSPSASQTPESLLSRLTLQEQAIKRGARRWLHPRHHHRPRAAPSAWPPGSRWPRRPPHGHTRRQQKPPWRLLPTCCKPRREAWGAAKGFCTWGNPRNLQGFEKAILLDESGMERDP